MKTRLFTILLMFFTFSTVFSQSYKGEGGHASYVVRDFDGTFDELLSLGVNERNIYEYKYKYQKGKYVHYKHEDYYGYIKAVKRVGEWRFYDENKNLRLIANFADHREVKRSIDYYNHDDINTARVSKKLKNYGRNLYDKKHGAWKLYYSNHKIKEEGTYYNGYKIGWFYHYNENGMVIKSEYCILEGRYYSYINNTRIYDDNGVVINDSKTERKDFSDKYEMVKNYIDSISFSNQQILDSIIQHRNNLINSQLNRLKKEEYEKQADFEKRRTIKQKELENKYNLEHMKMDYVWERFAPYNSKTLPPKVTYDPDNEVMKIEFENLNPILVKITNSNWVSLFRSTFEKMSNHDVTTFSNIYYYHLNIDVGTNKKLTIINGKLNLASYIKVSNDYLKNPKKAMERLFLDDNNYYAFFSIDNTLPFKSVENKMEHASELLEAFKKKQIIPALSFFNNFDKSELLVSHSHPYLNTYLKKFKEKVETKRKNLRNIREDESINDYKNYLYTSPYLDDDLLNTIFDINEGLDWNNFSKKEYDAENEVFKISYSGYGNIYVTVPINDAPKFGEALEKRYLNIKPQFVFLDDNTIAAKKIKFYNNNLKYYYNADHSIVFKNDTIKLLSNASVSEVNVKEKYEKLEKEKIEKLKRKLNFLNKTIAKKIEEIEKLKNDISKLKINYFANSKKNYEDAQAKYSNFKRYKIEATENITQLNEQIKRLKKDALYLNDVILSYTNSINDFNASKDRTVSYIKEDIDKYKKNGQYDINKDYWDLALSKPLERSSNYYYIDISIKNWKSFKNPTESSLAKELKKAYKYLKKTLPLKENANIKAVISFWLEDNKVTYSVFSGDVKASKKIRKLIDKKIEIFDSLTRKIVSYDNDKNENAVFDIQIMN